jgi:predicted DNA-binding helix-hairpin-helix protein
VLLLSQPDTAQKLATLGSAAQFDLLGGDEAAGCGASLPGDRPADRLSPYLSRPTGGGKGPLLKVLLTSSCENGCRYCALCAGRDTRRSSFQPDELASAFMELFRRGRASGLFLSSALGGNPIATMDSMLRAVEILRYRHRFHGYVHLKILPGATDQYIEAACRLADRVSANLEAPNPERLAALCPDKRFQQQLEAPLHRVAEIRRRDGVLPLGQTTQFVVGAAGESDGEILETTGRLYREVQLTRAYYSAFAPVEGTPLEDRPPASAARQHRLYQADALLRQYGFEPDEIPLDPEGNLLRERDPKQEWAQRHPEQFPLEVSRATRGQLLRVPGVGPRGADALLRARRAGRLGNAESLKGLGLILSRAAPFLLLGGRRLTPEHPTQLALPLSC